MKKTFKPNKQPQPIAKAAVSSLQKQSGPKLIDERQLRHIAGGNGTMLPQRNW